MGADRSLAQEWERWSLVCRNAVKRYRCGFTLELSAEDMDEMVRDVLIQVAGKIRRGEWEFASREMLEWRIINALRDEKRRRIRETTVMNIARDTARTAWLSEEHRSLEFPYWQGVGCSAEDRAHELLLWLPYLLPDAEGAVASAGISSGLELRKKESHRWIGSALGYSEGTVRKYIERAWQCWVRMKSNPDLDWERCSLARRSLDSGGCVGFLEVLRDRIPKSSDDIISMGTADVEKLLAVTRAFRDADLVACCIAALCCRLLCRVEGTMAEALQRWTWLLSEATAIIQCSECSEETIKMIGVVREELKAMLVKRME